MGAFLFLFLKLVECLLNRRVLPDRNTGLCFVKHGDIPVSHFAWNMGIFLRFYSRIKDTCCLGRGTIPY